MPNNNVVFGVGLLGIVGVFVIASVMVGDGESGKIREKKVIPFLSCPSNEKLREMIDLDEIEIECATSSDVDNQWIRDKNRIRYSGFCGGSHSSSFTNKGSIGCTKSQFHIDETMEWAIPYITQSMGNLLWMKLSHGIKLALMREEGLDGLSISVFSNKSIQHYVEYIDETSLVSHYYFSVHEMDERGMVSGEPLYNVELNIRINSENGVKCSLQ